MTPAELITRKRDGQPHSEAELREIVRQVMDGSMADYQVSAWLMAVFLNGMIPDETRALAIAMSESGERVDWGCVPGIKLDKHSSGGVGDKTTLVVVPILAAAGVPMLKMSGRGLGHAGGTVDKLESIPGFRTNLSAAEARDQVSRIGAAMIGQSPSLAPADKKLYALRDVTATVESLPLIAASIMSKKLAGSADRILLDVKVGRGAYLKERKQAEALARMMVQIGNGAGVKTLAVLTDMDEPLGFAVGNGLEVREACATLTGGDGASPRFREECLALAARGLVLAGMASDAAEASSMAEQILRSGRAAEKFREVIKAQGGDPRVVDEPQRMPHAPFVRPAISPAGGYVSGIDAEAVGKLAMAMGAGREHQDESIDPAVGIWLRKKTGDLVEAGETLADLHCREAADGGTWSGRLTNAYSIAARAPKERPVVVGVID